MPKRQHIVTPGGKRLLVHEGPGRGVLDSELWLSDKREEKKPRRIRVNERLRERFREALLEAVFEGTMKHMLREDR